MTCRSVSPAFSNLLKLMNASSWSTMHQKRSNPLKTQTWLNQTKSDFLWGWPNFLYHLLSVDSKSINSGSPSTQTYFSFNWLKIILITRTSGENVSWLTSEYQNIADWHVPIKIEVTEAQLHQRVWDSRLPILMVSWI